MPRFSSKLSRNVSPRAGARGGPEAPRLGRRGLCPRAAPRAGETPMEFPCSSRRHAGTHAGTQIRHPVRLETLGLGLTGENWTRTDCLDSLAVLPLRGALNAATCRPCRASQWMIRPRCGTLRLVPARPHSECLVMRDVRELWQRRVGGYSMWWRESVCGHGAKSCAGCGDMGGEQPTYVGSTRQAE